MSRLVEEWRPIKDYEGLYEVSDWGNVRSLDHIVYQKNKKKVCETHYKGRLLKFIIGAKNYYRVALCKNNKVKKYFVHQLVARAFIPNPEKKVYIDHLDGDPTNNCITNLKWCTHKENNNNPVTLERLSLAKIGYVNREVKPVARCDENWVVLEIYPSMKDARRNGFCNVHHAIYKSQTHIHNGFKWKFIN